MAANSPHARRAALLLAGAVLTGCATGERSGATGGAGLFKGSFSDVAGGVAPGPNAYWYVQNDPIYARIGVVDWRQDPRPHGSAFSRWVSRMFGRHDAPATGTALAGLRSNLPVPSIVEVTNLANGATARVKVEDRAPMGDALISLSPDVAHSLAADTSKPMRALVRYRGPVVAWREHPTLRYALRGRMPAPAASPAKAPETVLAAQTRPSAPVAAAAYAVPTVVKAELPGPVTTAPRAPAPPPTPTPTPTPAVVVKQAAPAPEPALRAELAPSRIGGGQLFRVQAGAFASLDNAHHAVAMVSDAGSVRIEPIKRGDRTLYRVIVQGRRGETGDALRAKVAKAGFADARVLPS